MVKKNNEYFYNDSGNTQGIFDSNAT